MAKLISIPVAKETGISGTTTLVASGTATSYTANKLTDSGATFITDLVAVGDTVKDVTNGDTALVTAIESETVLSLDTDIFSASNEDYEVSVPANELFDSSADFSSGVSAGDWVINTTANPDTDAKVKHIKSKFRLELTENIMSVSEAYKLVEGKATSNQYISSSDIVMVQRTGDLSTVISLNTLSNNTCTLVTTTDSAANEYVKKAVQLAMVKAEQGAPAIPVEVEIVPPDVQILSVDLS